MSRVHHIYSSTDIFQEVLKKRSTQPVYQIKTNYNVKKSNELKIIDFIKDLQNIFSYKSIFYTAKDLESFIQKFSRFNSFEYKFGANSFLKEADPKVLRNMGRGHILTTSAADFFRKCCLEFRGFDVIFWENPHSPSEAILKSLLYLSKNGVLIYPEKPINDVNSFQEDNLNKKFVFLSLFIRHYYWREFNVCAVYSSPAKDNCYTIIFNKNNKNIKNLENLYSSFKKVKQTWELDLHNTYWNFYSNASCSFSSALQGINNIANLTNKSNQIVF